MGSPALAQKFSPESHTHFAILSVYRLFQFWGAFQVCAIKEQVQVQHERARCEAGQRPLIKPRIVVRVLTRADVSLATAEVTTGLTDRHPGLPVELNV